MSRWWLWAALGATLLLIASQQTWATGTWQDPVLGRTRVATSGAEVSGTLTAGALLAGAALLAGLVGSRPVRLVAACCLAGGAVLAGVPAGRTLLAPGPAVEEMARERPGAATVTAGVEDATATLWPALGLVAAALVMVGALLCVGQWLRGRSTSPGAAAPGVTGQPADGPDGTGARRTRPARPSDPWDDLTRGHDPTVED